MNWLEQTIAEFGRTLGIDGLGFNDQGVVSLQFERLGALFVEQRADAVWVYLVRELSQPDRATLRRALEICHFRHHHPFPVHAALRRDNELVFLARIVPADFALPTLERVIKLLDQLHQHVTA